MGEQGYVITAASISQIENGSGTSGPTLTAIASATGYPVGYFMRRRGDVDAPAFFRSLRSTPAAQRKRALARAHLVHELVDAIEHYVELPDLDLPDLDVDLIGDPDEVNRRIEDAALVVRRYWDLGLGPIDHVVRHLERNGVVVCRLPLERRDIDAFSVPFEGRPVIVLASDKKTMARSRFDAAHELGHILLGHGPDDVGKRAAEQQAHRFAAAFLMPAAGIRDELPSRADWVAFFNLKAKWRVSVGALLQRAKDLHVMSEARHLSAIKYLSARGWRTVEPGDEALGPPEQPRLLNAALEVLPTDGGPTLEEVAEEASLPVDQLHEMLGGGVGRSVRRVRL
jgi:Zn-dependent peptidase ImmA (M78 family)